MNKLYFLAFVILLLITNAAVCEEKPNPNSGRAEENEIFRLDTIYTPEIGGIRQVIEVKTDDQKKPILLFLSGGPGSSMMKSAGNFTNLLKEKFTLVQWDQRDAGQTLQLNASPKKPTVVQMQQDTYEVIEFITTKLKHQKVYLLGSSWGNVLGFSIVKNHPELLHAYFASNSVINQLPSERALLKILKAYFADNTVAKKELATVNIPFQSDNDLFYLRKWLFYKDGKEFALTKGFEKGFMNWAKTWSSVFNDVMKVDLTKSLTKVECPVYFFVGKNDIQTSAEITKHYFNSLDAKKKELIVFKNSGHQIHHDEPEKFQNEIIRLTKE